MTLSSAAALMVAIVGLLGHPVAPAVRANDTPGEFCSAPGPRDYESPLAELPSVTSVPPRSKDHPGLGNLPFGPRRVEMYETSVGHVLVGGGRFGYTFWDVGFLGHHPETPTVDWGVTARLLALDRDGGVVEEVDHTRTHIGRIDGARQPSIDLPVPSRPGFYRFDIQVRDGGGGELGSYSQYLRVVPRSVRVRLGINRGTVRPGAVVAVRPEELGTEWLTYGESFVVQRRTGGDWQRYDLTRQELWELWLGGLGPGAAGGCNRLLIPSGTPPGRYRILKTLGVEIAPRVGRSFTVTAPFRVLPGPR